MKWRNHRLVTAAAVFFLGGGHVLPTLAACAGSTFPDSVEGEAYGKRRMAHRRHSHWWLYYAAIALLCNTLLLGGQWTLGIALPSAAEALRGVIDAGLLVTLAAHVAQWFCVGALAHLAEDFFCGGVPVPTPYRRWGWRLFHVGTWREDAIAWLAVAACYMCRAIESFEAIRLL